MISSAAPDPTAATAITAATLRHSRIVQPVPKMIMRKLAVRIYVVESCAFLAIISLSWANELLDIPHWLFDGREHAR
jgi:hypothetical protein